MILYFFWGAVSTPMREANGGTLIQTRSDPQGTERGAKSFFAFFRADGRHESTYLIILNNIKTLPAEPPQASSFQESKRKLILKVFTVIL